MVILESKRLVLRKFCPDDWRDIYEYLSLEEVVRYEPYNLRSEEECKEIAISRSKGEDFWAVCLKGSTKVIGNVYFHREDPIEFLTYSIGYVFNPLYHGKGYATEAAQRMLRYGFEDMKAHRIVARCDQGNSPSLRLLERLSMRREGDYLKPAFLKKTPDGQPIWHDLYEYSILHEEWFGET